MDQELTNFYTNQSEPNRSCLLVLRDIILEQDELVNETRKWGMPCFCYKKKMFCFLWTDKQSNEPYVLMVEGDKLDHPKLEQGKRARMKIFPVNPIEDIPISTLTTVLNDALDLYRNGIIPVK